DHEISRGGRAGGERGAIAGVERTEELPSSTQKGLRMDVLATEGERPFGDARQVRTRDVLDLRPAGVLERGWRVWEGNVLAVGVGGGPVEREMAVHRRAGVDLDAAHAHLLGVGEIAAQHAHTCVHDLRLEVVDLGVIQVVTRGRGSVFTPPSMWPTSSGLTVAAERTGRPRVSVGTPFRLRPTDLK